jgi:hypothetical protein
MKELQKRKKGSRVHICLNELTYTILSSSKTFYNHKHKKPHYCANDHVDFIMEEIDSVLKELKMRKINVEELTNRKTRTDKNHEHHFADKPTQDDDSISPVIPPPSPAQEPSPSPFPSDDESEIFINPTSNEEFKASWAEDSSTSEAEDFFQPIMRISTSGVSQSTNLLSSSQVDYLGNLWYGAFASNLTSQQPTQCSKLECFED